jgi:hypothetical protein
LIDNPFSSIGKYTSLPKSTARIPLTIYRLCRVVDKGKLSLLRGRSTSFPSTLVSASFEEETAALSEEEDEDEKEEGKVSNIMTFSSTPMRSFSGGKMIFSGMGNIIGLRQGLGIGLRQGLTQGLVIGLGIGLAVL